MKKYICTVCGYIHEGDAPPEVCPICKVGADKFEEVQGEMQWADEHRIGVAKDIDKDIIEGLRANFVGECTEVGMYLAMARQADREGYPEVAEAYTRIAYEEAEHAAGGMAASRTGRPRPRPRPDRPSIPAARARRRRVP